jgi:ketosteroid isomerase-like protein
VRAERDMRACLRDTGRAMSHEHVEIVCRLYERAPAVERVLRAGGRVGDHPWLSLWHPECVLEEIADVADHRAHRGREGVARYFEDAYRDVWEEWRFMPVEIIDGSDGVFAAVDSWGRSKAGVELELRIFQAFHFRDGLVAHATAYLERRQALNAVGVGE